MASKILWGLDIGQGSLKAVRAQKSGNRIEVLAFDCIEYNLTSSDNEQERDAAIRQALTTFLGRHDVSKEDVLVCAPAHSALVRFIKLPPVDKKNLKNIVRYEAHQQIPFPLEEVIWDYQAIDRGFVPGEEVEVGIFAMRKELIHRFLSNLMLVNLEPTHFQVAPIAVYNFLMYEKPPSAGAVIVIDIGANNTDLLIISQERVWARNLPIAANDLTNAIAREFNLPYEKAETLKRKASKSKYQARIYEAMKPALKGLIDECQRSVGYYRSVNPTQRIDHVLVMGSAFKLPGLGRFLFNNLQYEVRKLSALQNYITDNALNIDTYRENPLGFGAALGLITQGLGLGAMDTNLMPEEILTRRALSRKRPWAFVVGGLLLLMVAINYLQAITTESQYKGQLIDVNPETVIRDINGQKMTLEDIKRLKREHDSVKGGASRLKNKLNGYIDPGKGRDFWLDIVDSVYLPIKRLAARRKASPKEFEGHEIWIQSFVPNLKSLKPADMTIDLSIRVVTPDDSLTMDFFYMAVKNIYRDEVPFLKVTDASIVSWPETTFLKNAKTGYFLPWGVSKSVDRGAGGPRAMGMDGDMEGVRRKKKDEEELISVKGRAISYRIQFVAKDYKQWLKDKNKPPEEKKKKDAGPAAQPVDGAPGAKTPAPVPGAGVPGPAGAPPR